MKLSEKSNPRYLLYPEIDIYKKTSIIQCNMPPAPETPKPAGAIITLIIGSPNAKYPFDCRKTNRFCLKKKESEAEGHPPKRQGSPQRFF
jgi:hypothetical protein